MPAGKRTIDPSEPPKTTTKKSTKEAPSPAKAAARRTVAKNRERMLNEQAALAAFDAQEPSISDLEDIDEKEEVPDSPNKTATGKSRQRLATLNRLGTEEGDGIDDPVRMYLREIGKVFLLSAADEKFLARQMEEGNWIHDIEEAFAEENRRSPTALETFICLLQQLENLRPVIELIQRTLKLKKLGLIELMTDPTFRDRVDGGDGRRAAQQGAKAVAYRGGRGRRPTGTSLYHHAHPHSRSPPTRGRRRGIDRADLPTFAGITA